ncbi:DUF726 domain-containing protein [Pseudomonas putida]
MEKHFKFLTLPHQGTGTVANVFIHGYSAGHDLRDRRMLSRHIPSTLQGGVNLFGFWPSGHILKMDWETVQAFISHSKGTPYGLGGLVGVARDRVMHFSRSRQRAEHMGQVLPGELQQYLAEHHPQVTTVNLVGHSLGGRVLVSALKTLKGQPDGFRLKIGDVLLMAAAVQVSALEGWSLRETLDGRLLNAWSKADKTLRLLVDETCLGRNQVSSFDNVEMSGFDHTDYWPNLHQVLKDTGFAGFQGQHYPVPLDHEQGAPPDPVRADYLLHDLLELSPPAMLEQATKHLKTSSWVTLDAGEPLYGFTREFQLLAGHCLVNLARGKGLPYVEALEMLADHFDLGKVRHECATVLELETVLVARFFQNSFPEGHVFASDTLTQVKNQTQAEYFQQVDALAERLTLASYVNVPASKAPAQAVVARDTQAVAMPSLALLPLGSWGQLVSSGLSAVVGRALTNLMTAIKPGYSALIPAVAVVFYARVTLDNHYLTI